jgi:hypothetical protein
VRGRGAEFQSDTKAFTLGTAVPYDGVPLERFVLEKEDFSGPNRKVEFCSHSALAHVHQQRRSNPLAIS